MGMRRPSISTSIASALGHEAGIQADHRAHAGATAEIAGHPRRHAGGGLGHFAGKKLQRRARRMGDGDLDHHLTRGRRRGAGVRAVHGLGAERIDIHRRIARQPARAEQALGLCHDRAGVGPPLRRRIEAGDDEQRGGAIAVAVGGRDLVHPVRRTSAGTGHTHPRRTRLGQPDRGEIAGHVRQFIGARIADFVKQLLTDAMRAHHTAGGGGLGEHELAVGTDLDDRETHVVEITLHLTPIGEIATGTLTAAFNQVPGQAACGEAVVVVPGPAEFMHQRREGDRAVDTATGDHDIGARSECFDNGGRAEISIQADEIVGQARRFAARGRELRGQFGACAEQVVAVDDSDTQHQPGFGRRRDQGVATGGRIDAAGIADHADALRLDRAEQRRDGMGDEVVRVAGIGVALALGGENGQGDFRQVVEHQIVQLAARDQLCSSGIRIAPERGRAADAYRIHRRLSPPKKRRAGVRSAPVQRPALLHVRAQADCNAVVFKSSRVTYFRTRRRRARLRSSPAIESTMASASPAAAYQRQISAEKRDAILDAALECFLERGFSGTSLSRIARAADVSTATIYRHFPTKDELFAQIIERPFLGAIPDARSDWPAGEPHTALSQIAEQYARRILTPYFHPLVRALIAEALRLPQMGHALEQRGHGPFLAAVRQYLERENAIGTLVVADPGLAAEQFLGMISSVVFWPRMLNDQRRPSAAKVKRSCDEAAATCLARYAPR